MGRGVRMAEEQGAISKVSTQDEKTNEALRTQTNSQAPSLKKIKSNNKQPKNKTSKSAVGSNPLNKSSTGLEIRRV
jgi:hypothetical protein